VTVLPAIPRGKSGIPHEKKGKNKGTEGEEEAERRMAEEVVKMKRLSAIPRVIRISGIVFGARTYLAIASGIAFAVRSSH